MATVDEDGRRGWPTALGQEQNEGRAMAEIEPRGKHAARPHAGLTAGLGRERETGFAPQDPEAIGRATIPCLIR
jgi:hypothetical protein